ncbi:hypothetical protein ABK040_009334 [Willaertia magna]
MRLLVKVIHDGQPSNLPQQPVSEALLRQLQPKLFDFLPSPTTSTTSSSPNLPPSTPMKNSTTINGLNNNNNQQPVKLIERRFLSIIPETYTFEELKETVAGQYQSIFYDKILPSPGVNDEFSSVVITDPVPSFIVTQIYNENGLPIGLWERGLKPIDILKDNQVIFVKIDCSKRNIKLKEKYVKLEEEQQKKIISKSQENDIRNKLLQDNTPTKKVNKKPTVMEIEEEPEEEEEEVVSNTEDESDYITTRSSNKMFRKKENVVKQEIKPKQKAEEKRGTKRGKNEKEEKEQTEKKMKQENAKKESSEEEAEDEKSAEEEEQEEEEEEEEESPKSKRVDLEMLQKYFHKEEYEVFLKIFWNFLEQNFNTGDPKDAQAASTLKTSFPYLKTNDKQKVLGWIKERKTKSK